MKKELLLSDYEVILEIASSYNFDNDFMSNLTKIKSDIDDYSVKLMFVGGFSAGKSALINSTLEMDVLTENQLPQTAIATEIVYDTDEYIEAVGSGGCERYNVGQIDNIPENSCDYLIAHLNNKNLLKFGDFTFVDMPGFNSGIEKHNKAILRYAGNGNAYILVIDVEAGEIKSSISDFIREIKNYDNNLCVVVSKTDKKTTEEATRIINEIALTASYEFENGISVIGESKMDEDTPAKMLDLISKFDIQSLFEQKIAPELKSLAKIGIVYLQGILKAGQLNNENLENEIRDHMEAKKKLEEKLGKEKIKLDKKIRGQVKDQVICDVQTALFSNTDSLAAAAAAGGNAFSAAVNNIIRPVLINSITSNVEISCDEMVCDIGKVIKDSEVDFSSITNAIQDLLIAKKDEFNAPDDNKKPPLFGDKGNTLYKGATGLLALTTNIVSPLLEVAIMFIPEVLKFFSNLLGRNSEEDKTEMIKNKINGEIIPQIIQKLSGQIDTSLSAMSAEAFEEIKKTINARIDIEAQAYEDALKRRDETVKKDTDRQSKINMDIDKLNNLKYTY